MKMKKIYTFACGAMLLAGLASCEMKEELFNNGKYSGDTGTLQLGLSVNTSTDNVTTKADSDDTIEEKLPNEEAEGFTIELSGTYDTTFIYATDMESVLLPVGDYMVYAHSTMEDGLQKYMSVPYYGKKQTATISKGIETQINVLCGMENTKFQLVYNTDFSAMYEQWEITVSAGDCAKTYKYNSETDGDTPQSPAAEYWLLADNVKDFTVNVTAWTKNDRVQVTQSKSFSKTDASNFTGGDAIRINMEPGDPSASTEGQATINITVQVFSEYEELTEEVPVTGEDDPGTGGGGNEDADAVSISIPKSTYTLPADMGLAENANATIAAAAGLKSIKVTIEPHDESVDDVNVGFTGALDAAVSMFGVDFKNGVELVVESEDDSNKTKLENVFSMIAPGTTVPIKGATEYKFPVGKFFGVLGAIGKTTSEGHVFKIEVIDNNDNPSSTQLNIVVTEQIAASGDI